MAGFNMDDYVDVAERIQDFLDAYPGGSLGLTGHGVYTVAGKDFVWCEVAAMRSELDTAPGVGIAWEPVPGLTSFTKNSEMQNAHTAAMGRAIIALGLMANRKLASRTEVRNRIAEQTEAANPAPETKSEPAPKADKPKPARVPKLTADEKRELGTLYVASGWDQQTLALQLVLVGALVGKDVDALGEYPSDDAYKGLIGPAMSALTQDQFKLVKSNLEGSVAQADASAKAAA